MKEIATKRLLIRNWLESDFDDMFELNSDPIVNPVSGCSTVASIEKMMELLKAACLSSQSFAIVLKSENKVIGTIGFDDFNQLEDGETKKQAYIGFRLNSKYWERGYATEACQRFIEYLFKEMDFGCVWTSHYDFNSKSKRVIEKTGFIFQYDRSVIVKSLDNRNAIERFYRILSENYRLFVENTKEYIEMNLYENQLKFVSTPKRINEGLSRIDTKGYNIIFSTKVIGFLLLRYFEPDKVFIWDLIIDKDYQQRGFGNKVIEFITQKMISDGVTILTTTCKSNNKEAISFFLSNGFQIMNGKQNSSNLDEVDLVLKLKP